MIENSKKKRTALDEICNSPHFIAGLSDYLRGQPFRDFSSPRGQERYERGRATACLAQADGNTRRFMEGDVPAAWVRAAFAEGLRARIIL